MIELNVRAFNFVVNTRAQRRAALAMIVKQLDMIRDAEIKCLENMPLNFRLSTKHNNGIAFVEMIEFGIDYLSRVYMEEKSFTDNLNSNVYPY